MEPDCSRKVLSVADYLKGRLSIAPLIYDPRGEGLDGSQKDSGSSARRRVQIRILDRTDNDSRIICFDFDDLFSLQELSSRELIS